jgi:hypothetical protein
MSPLSVGVLSAATVVSSPALWLSLVDHTLALDVALPRDLVAVVVCWALLSLVASLAFPDPGSVKARPSEPADGSDHRSAGSADSVRDPADGTSGVDVA